MPSLKIIIAHYNEEIEWTQQFKDTIIYNKGINCKYNHINLPNVGREGHTYAKYIVDNYDSLDDYTCFLQGRPFDHSPDVIEKINNFTYNCDFYNLNIHKYDCRVSGCRHHYNIPINAVYAELFGTENPYYKYDKPFYFGAGAQFIVSKKIIQSRPKEFYEKIVKMLEYHINPIEGFVIERLWSSIFHHPNLETYEYIQMKEF